MVRRPEAAVSSPSSALNDRLPSGEDGMSLVEVIVALVILAVIMTSSALFFINGLKNSSLQSQRQTAVTLANQALEAVQAVKPENLLKGRTVNDVNGLGTKPAGDLAGGNIDLASTAVDGWADDVVKANPDPVNVAGMAYTIKTFIDLCYLNSDGTGKQSCTTTVSPKTIYRATVAVMWTPRTVSCPGGCRYAASVLIDKQLDPQFNSNVSQPLIDSVTPSSALAGSTQTLTINGSAFVAGATVAIGAGGGTMGVVTGNTGLQLTVVWNVGTVAGSYDLSVTNPDGGRAFYSVTVVPRPVITGIAPNPIRNLASTSVTLTGTGFQSGAVITMTNGTAVAATYVSATSILVTLRPDGTQPGPATVTVTNPDTGAGSYSLPLLPSQPTISSGTQGTVAAVGSPTTMILTGTDFVVGASVTASNATVSSVVVNSSTSATVTFTPNAANPSTTFTLTNGDGGSVARTLPVATSVPVVPAPTLSGAMQGTTAPVGQPTTVTLTGSNLTGATVSASTGTVTGVTASSATSITVTFVPSLANTATTFTVATTGGTASRSLTVQTTATAAFTITDYSATRPNNGNNNRLSITLRGTGFLAGGNVRGTWAGGSTTATNLIVQNSTLMTFDMDFPNGNFNKTVTFTVTNGNGATLTAQQQVVF